MEILEPNISLKLAQEDETLEPIFVHAAIQAISKDLPNRRVTFSQELLPVFSNLRLGTGRDLHITLQNFGQNLEEIVIVENFGYQINLHVENYKSPARLSITNNSHSTVTIQNIDAKELVANGANFAIAGRSINHLRVQGIKTSFVASMTISDFDIQGAFVSDCIFNDCRFERILLDHGSRFIGLTEFTHCHFSNAPDISRCKLENISPRISFNDCNFFPKAVDESRFRILKDMARSRSNDIDEATFAGCEMACRRLKIRDFTLERCVSGVYYFVNNYGMDTFKPVKMLYWTFLTTFGVLSIWSLSVTGLIKLLPDSPAKELAELNGYWIALFESISLAMGPLNLFSKFNIFRITGWYGTTFTWAVSLWTSFLWVFIIAGIRKRFKTH